MGGKRFVKRYHGDPAKFAVRRDLVHQYSHGVRSQLGQLAEQVSRMSSGAEYTIHGQPPGFRCGMQPRVRGEYPPVQFKSRPEIG